MIQAIHEFQGVLMEVRTLHYKENNKLRSIKSKILMLLDNFLPQHDFYKTHLADIKFKSEKAADENIWIKGQRDLIDLLETIIDDLNIIHKSQLKKSEKLALGDEYESEYQRIRNDLEKDIVFERNKLRHLERKFNMLNLEHKQLQNQFDQLLGTRDKWILYGCLTFVAIASVWFFDLLFSWPQFEALTFAVHIKIALSALLAIILLNIPLKNPWFKFVPFLLLTAICLLVLTSFSNIF